MRKLNRKPLSHILICISIISIAIVILWLVLEYRFTRDGNHERQLQDWLFTASYCVFFLSTVSCIILRSFGKIKNKAVRAILTVISCLIFTTAAFYGYDYKAMNFGQKAYANQHIYLKYYFNFRGPADFYYLYKIDGILFIKEGEKPELIGFYLYDDDIDSYIDTLKNRTESSD